MKNNQEKLSKFWIELVLFFYLFSLQVLQHQYL